MLAGMAIRMIEWGTLSPPRGNVQIPTAGLGNTAASIAALGRGLAAFPESAATYLREEERREEKAKQEAAYDRAPQQELPRVPAAAPAAVAPALPPAAPADAEAGRRAALQQVEDTGRLASFTNDVQGVFRDTAASLLADRPQDWNYAWQRESAPALAEAISALPPALRERGRELASLYSEQASVQAQREHELGSIADARGLWQQQVDDAVAAGDEERACRWLAAGHRVFVAEGEMEARMQEARSRSSLARWQRNLEQNPVETLRAWRGEEAEPPQGEPERRALEAAVAEQTRHLQQVCGDSLAQDVAAGREPNAETLAQLRAAGVLPGLPHEAAGHSPVYTAAELCRRIDEHDEQDAAALRLQVAAAELPLRQRADLLRRMETAAALPRESRCAVSRGLWNMYRAGRFGCPGDEGALRTLHRLQGESLASLQGGSEPAAWVAGIRSGENRWVCFES